MVDHDQNEPAFYTEEEIERIRALKREGIRRAMEVAEPRGYHVHPRIVKARKDGKNV